MSDPSDLPYRKGWIIMPKTLVIDRNQWLRNEPDASYLYRLSDGKKCCLGMYAEQICGYTIGELAGKRTPDELKDVDGRPGMEEMVSHVKDSVTGCDRLCNSLIARQLMDANDGCSLGPSSLPDRISDEDIELLVADLFREIGVGVEFV